MNRVAVLMAEGFEEGETVTIVDILRRAEIVCHTFSLGDLTVKGMHGMRVRADKVFGDEVMGYDALVLPGGRPGGQNLRDHPGVVRMVRDFGRAGKFLAAMCSGTIVLSDAAVIAGKKVTGYAGYQDKLVGGIFQEDVVVVDGTIITSRGPATPYPFAYKIVDVLGRDSGILKKQMLYAEAGGM
jgi:4-methyl-5(b-hydroxyethyl)-thiazole monophosphate biosynthesis